MTMITMTKDEVRLLIYRTAQFRMQYDLGIGDQDRKRAIINSVCLNCCEPVVDEKTREFEYLSTGICSHCQQAAVAEISGDDIAELLIASSKQSVAPTAFVIDALLLELGAKMEKALVDRRHSVEYMRLKCRMIDE